jgi:hypothetical protein
LKTFDFSAGVFIGCKEGAEREFRLFPSFHPSTPALPIGTTGSACVNLLEEVRDKIERKLYHALRDETAYGLSMQKILPPPIALAKTVRWCAAAPRFGGDDTNPQLKKENRAASANTKAHGRPSRA